MATGSLTLDALWIHLASSPEVYTTVGVRGFTEAQVFDGETVMFANGRLRAIVGPGKSKSYEVSLKLVPRSTIDALRGFANLPVMLRDQRGRLLYGQIFNLNIGEDMLPGAQTGVAVGSISFTFSEITYEDEA